MSRHGARERIVILLARFIAGPERRHWLDAMEAELDALPDRRLDWALGSLVAAAKDRAWRERAYALALVLAPTAALAAIPIASIALSLLAELTSLTVLQFTPIIALTPLPFAMALGALNPRRPAFVSGALGFAAYLAIPAIALPLLFAPYVYVRWEATLSAYALPPSGLVGSLGLWCFGAWAGAKGTLRRRGPTPPSP
jgi:hypothetical protein